MRTLSFRSHVAISSLTIFLVCAFVAGGFFPVRAQAQSYSYGRASRTSSTVSKEEQEALDKVSLSADTIIRILQNEPGLLLQVKKMLVHKAFEQGRVLESADLTDEALFRLVREQENIRILATREIEDRSYIKARPSHEEIEHQNALSAQRGVSRTSDDLSEQNPFKTPKGVSQEDQYWSTHQTPEQTNPSSLPQTNQPQNPPAAAPIENNPARQVDLASLQNQGGFDTMGILGTNSASMSRVTPDQLAELLGGGGSSGSLSLASSSGSNRNPLSSNASSLGSAGLLGGGMSPAIPVEAPDFGASPYDQTSQRLQQARLQQPRRPIHSPSDLDQDRPIIHQRPNPYADVPSLYDLYAQVGNRSATLSRFGMDVFRNGTGNLDDLPMDLPAGPDYVLGPGDGLRIDLWGGVAQRLQRVVDRQGQLTLPEIGALQVSGRTLGDVQHIVQTALRTQFRNVEADISLARIRMVRVYVVGEVEQPGPYDISSLSTPLNALYAAGGPTSRGSLRHVRQSRGKQLVQEIDAYDLLLHGIHSELAHIESGDTILVPPMGSQVTVEGMVRRPAMYELDGEKGLSEVLELAGGVLPSGTLRHVDVERVIAHESRTMLRLDMPESNDQQAVNKVLQDFQVQDGDKIRISPILPYADKTVYLDGHVFHPGKFPYRDGMKVTDLVRSYSDLMPEPSQRHAEIIRLQPPDYRPVVLAFNLGQAMEGKDADLVLKPFDTLRIYGRFDFEDQPLISVSGEVRDPGQHLTNGVLHLRDAIYLAGGLTPDAQLDNAQIYRRSEDGTLKVLSVDLKKALSGDSTENVLLQPKDRVLVPRNMAKVDPPTVQIQGEVSNPGRYPLGSSMTVSDLVKVAGGFQRGADTEQADLATYDGQDGAKNIGKHQTIEIAKAMVGDADANVVLHDGDVLSIRQLAGWKDRGASVTISGEVLHPGTFGIHEGEKLSSVLARAGGFRMGAYPYGAILERAQIREIEEKDRLDLIGRVEKEGAGLKLLPESDLDQKAVKDSSLAQWETTLEKLQSTPPSGRMVVHISSDTKHWANTNWDPELRAGDRIAIPKKPNFVMVSGSVYNQTAVTFRSGKNAAWYLNQAGGPTNTADKKGIFVVRADGSVVGGGAGLFSGGALGAELRPGDMLVVPEKPYSLNTKWRTALQASQLVSAVGIAISVAKTF